MILALALLVLITIGLCAATEWIDRQTPSVPRRAPFIETFTGVSFRPFEPVVEDIRINDIAHALSNQCRFSGHVRHFYSVAEHSVRVSRLVERLGHPPIVQLWGLLHDASEAYMVDLPTPLKAHPVFGALYREAEARLMVAIARRFQLPGTEPRAVRFADAVMLATEVRDLMPGRLEHWADLTHNPDREVVHAWRPRRAEMEFLTRFFALIADVKGAA